VPGRLRELFKDGSKYGVVGLFGTLLDFVIFNLLLFLMANLFGKTEPLSAKTISTILSAAVTYLLHGFWTFRNRGGSRRSLVTIALFGVVTAAGLVLSLGIVGFSHYFLGYTSLFANNVANSIALVVSALVRFFATRHLVFSNKQSVRTERGQI
jgi:putative flippase GtrA